jgi:predicted Zn-dependent protease
VSFRRPLGFWLVPALVLAACAAPVAPIGTSGRPFTLDADEQRLWAQADREAAALLARVPVYDDPALTAYLARLAERLTPPALAEAGGPRPHLIVLRDPTLAAFALPDGRLFLHTGLVAAVESEAQLALVLAREVAHVARRHALGAWRDGQVAPAPFAVRTALSPTAGTILGGRLPVLATIALSGYDAALEEHADAAGVAEVARAGWDPADAAAVWDVLARELGGRGMLEAFAHGRPAWLEERRRGTSRRPGAAVPGSSESFETLRRPLLRDNAGDDARHGRFALARRQLDRLLSAAPADARAHLQYGELHRLQSQWATRPEARDTDLRLARARYMQALTIDPGLAEAHRQLGLLAYQERDLTRARAELETYLRAAPSAPDARRIEEYVRELAR